MTNKNHHYSRHHTIWHDDGDSDSEDEDGETVDCHQHVLVI